jgi:hypothetical protein
MNDEQRAKLVSAAELVLNHRDSITYSEIRGKTLTEIIEELKQGNTTSIDASEMVTALFMQEGLNDPNGHDFAGVPFTGTMLDYLPHRTSLADAEVGDLVVFGDAPGTNVAMVIADDSDDPTLLVHGPNGPQAVKASIMPDRPTPLDSSDL